MPFPVCTSCGKSTRSHSRPDLCPPCNDSWLAFVTTFGRCDSLTSAQAVAKRCADAYSADRYASWSEVARILLKMGFTEAEAEAVMRSKITRWAADSAEFSLGATEGRRYRDGKIPARVVREYILSDEARRGSQTRNEIAEWAEEYVTAY